MPLPEGSSTVKPLDLVGRNSIIPNILWLATARTAHNGAMKASNLATFRGLWIVLTLVSGCQSGPSASTSPAEAELLNSERIELTFGSFGIEVLSADAPLRVSNLYSVEGGVRTCRTFAVVVYPERIDPALAEAHALIVSGQAIGETFAANGWSIEKRHRYFGEIADIQSRPRVAGLMGLTATANAAIHVYVFVVSKDGRAIDYATIAEIHHPDYLALREIAAIYGPDVGRFAVEREGLRLTMAAVLRELEED